LLFLILPTFATAGQRARSSSACGIPGGDEPGARAGPNAVDALMSGKRLAQRCDDPASALLTRLSAFALIRRHRSTSFRFCAAASGASSGYVRFGAKNQNDRASAFLDAASETNRSLAVCSRTSATGRRSDRRTRGGSWATSSTESGDHAESRRRSMLGN
jgi:hypothetical protein